MDTFLYIIMTLLGLVGAFFSGMLGIGGAIINFPLLLYVPSSLGLAQFSVKEVATISMFQVFFASLSGILALRMKRDQTSSIDKGIVLYMGSSILIGSLIGASGSQYLNEQFITIIYGTLALLALVLMLIPNRAKSDSTTGDLTFNKLLAVVSALFVGIVSGIVGAGGAFILIPIMLTIMKIPIRTAIASSLVIVFISAIGGVIGKLTSGSIPLWPTVFVVVGSLIGAPLGARIGSILNVRYLRYGLIALLIATSVKVWAPIF